MALLNKNTHIIKEVDGVRCSVVEEKVSADRKEFLKKLLEHNGFNVKIIEEKDELYTVLVEGVMFNPVIYVYERRLKTLNGDIVDVAYWLQLSDKGKKWGEPDFYWELYKTVNK